MLDRRLEELWAEVEGRWGDDGTHTAFLEHCRQTAQLDVAARLYRGMTLTRPPYRDEPTRAEGAKKRLAAVAVLAMYQLEVTRAPHEDRLRGIVQRRKLIRVVGLLLVLVGMIAFSLRR